MVPTLLYIERMFCHLNHPRIVHLCNLKEVSPSKRLVVHWQAPSSNNIGRTRKEKIISKKSWKRDLDNYEINQFHSISSSGRTYLLKIPHGRVRILYRSIHSYSSIKEKTFLKESGMLGPYNTSDSLITIVIVALIVIVNVAPYFYWCAHVSPMLLLLCPIEAHYCYYCALILLLLCRLWLCYDPLDSYIYIEEVFSFKSSKNFSFM